MKYRLANVGDVDGIKALCEKESLPFPRLETCFVAEDEKMVGFINIVNIPTIDCFISENPIAGKTLVDMAFGALMITGNKFVKFQTVRENMEKLALKYGFMVQAKNVTTLIKEV